MPDMRQVTLREVGVGMVIASAIFGGFALTWNQVSPWLVSPLPPVEVTSMTQRLVLMPDGRIVERLGFHVTIREECGSQQFVREFYDTISDDLVAPVVISGPGGTNQYFKRWLPLGSYGPVYTDYETQPGRSGTITLTGKFDQCRSGFTGDWQVYQINVHWTADALEAFVRQATAGARPDALQ
jgi:hypothetical protein